MRYQRLHISPLGLKNSFNIGIAIRGGKENIAEVVCDL
jgi:hypothetical protein